MSKSLQPKYRSRSPGQGICQVSTLRSTLQGLMVVGLIVEEISNVEIPGSTYLLSQEVREMCHARYDGCCRIVFD